jgi:hypothetical protein
MAFDFIVLWLGTGRWKARYWIERGLKERFTRFCYHILESCLVRLTETGNRRIFIIIGVEELNYYKVARTES